MCSKFFQDLFIHLKKSHHGCYDALVFGMSVQYTLSLAYVGVSFLDGSM